MTSLILALLLQLQGGWTTVWYVRFAEEHSPGDWRTLDVKASDPDSENPDCAKATAFLFRACAEAMRDKIIAHGWAFPSVLPNPGEPTGEVRIGPSQIKWPSVKRMLCRLDLPPPDRPPCQYPDGDPPPGQAEGER